MNRLEKIDLKIKRNYQLAFYSWFIGVMAGTIFWTWFLIWFAKGTIECIKTF